MSTIKNVFFINTDLLIKKIGTDAVYIAENSMPVVLISYSKITLYQSFFTPITGSVFSCMS